MRSFIGKFLVFLFEGVFKPKPMTRNPEQQTKLDQSTSDLILYHFEACPFCLKVRRKIQQLGLKIEMRDILKNSTYFDELMAGGGEDQAPCLKITEADGKVRW